MEQEQERLSIDEIEIPYRRTSGQVKVVCPNCKGKRSHPNDRSLSINLDTKQYKCHYCGISGVLTGFQLKTKSTPHKTYKKPSARLKTAFSDALVKWFNDRGISVRTMEAAKIAEGKVFLPQIGQERNTTQFCYYLNDELVNVKYRDGAKNFMLERGCELIPYNIDSLVGSDYAIVTEGEMDCLSFVEIGKTACVSVPNGANSNLSWLDDFQEGWFDDKEVIYIASDTDTKGLELRQELIRRFGAERCKVVTYGEGCKDANEHLVKYGNASLLECLTNAKDVKVDGVFDEADYDEELRSMYQYGLSRGMSLGLGGLDDKVTFETKRLMVVTGIPSSGKSEFIDEMCVRLNLNYGLRVAYFSPENMPLQIHAAKIIEKLVGKTMKHQPDNPNCMSGEEFNEAVEYYRENFFHIMPDNSRIDTILECATYWVRKRGIRILVIDPFNRLDDDTSDTEKVKAVINKCTKFARQYDALVIVMCHPRKTEGEQMPTPYDINGSAHFRNMADFGLTVHRDYEKEVTIVKVWKVKFRHLGQGGEVEYKYDTTCGRYNEWKAVTGTILNRSNWLRSNAVAEPGSSIYETQQTNIPF